MDARLQQYADAIATLSWAAMLLDADDRVLWLSDDFKHFIHEPDDAKLGIGEHVAVALLQDPYRQTMSPQSVLALSRRMMPYFLASLPADAVDRVPEMPPGLLDLLGELTPQEPPEHWEGSFDYVQPGVPSYPVHFLVSRLRDESGRAIGTAILTTVGLPSALLAMLAKGDWAMYERMARLVEPGRRQAAILFADLQSSGDLSRRLPTASYFALVRALTAEFDRIVGTHCGVVGKHAGDGMTAFFLADDAGSPGAAAAAACRAGRQLQANAASLAVDMLGDDSLRINAGVHWSGGLFMGQLVPGGRLEVTALGDEVNEAARLQETARDGALVVSKAIIELLDPAAAGELGVPSPLLYRPLAEIADAGPKAVRDAGHIAVAVL